MNSNTSASKSSAAATSKQHSQHGKAAVCRSAAVVGGGVAGLATAMALRQVGVEVVDVYEAYDVSAGVAIGAWLTIAVNGLAALRELGLDNAVMQCGFPSEEIEFHSGSGKHLGRIPIGGTLDDGTVTCTLRRADLYRVLLEEAKRRGVNVHSRKKLARIEWQTTADGTETNTASTLTFEDGSSVPAADLVVGADGIHSAVRQHLNADRQVQSRFMGMGNTGGFLPHEVVESVMDARTKQELSRGLYRMLFGYKCFFGYTVHPDTGDVWWFANPPLDHPLSKEEAKAADWRERLVTMFADDAGPAADVIHNTPEHITVASQYDLPHVPVWYRGNVVLLGDAAHAASPSSGQGVSLGVEDAVELARFVQCQTTVADAVAVFVAHRRPRAQRVVEYGARMSSQKVPGPIGRFFRDLIMPWILWLVKNQTQDWLFSYRARIAENTEEATK
ncbi:hypothetical protein PTSG_07553 [Salpingoeca rosetta]|uniref:FAD-binding domain-containing protein n=1 Tax=Salpingoeca rosetta (strain ATCC 50818 / BSB-021) TaxID=946362 RepID=F2UH36_SALR5|nr:uncharacterized protein PTSG_07553 [Salpingoeca rosetta]EGD76435.1 hypothetical protein PTSG_07553 [Salpingoeca rosetta]|eukprot:XP_004991350.1 hypothetical protein PTSG_07553 [Salpingoeca rosetta]